MLRILVKNIYAKITRLYWSSSDQYERHSDSPNSPPVSPPPPQVNIKKLGIQKKLGVTKKNFWNWKQKSKKKSGVPKNCEKIKLKNSKKNLGVPTKSEKIPENIEKKSVGTKKTGGHEILCEVQKNSL